jgi:hypothetical protein
VTNISQTTLDKVTLLFVEKKLFTQKRIRELKANLENQKKFKKKVLGYKVLVLVNCNNSKRSTY